MLIGLLAGGVQAAMGIGQAIGGAIGMRKKKREADAAIEGIQTYKGSKEIGGIYEGAKLRSTTGLSGAAKQMATQGAQQAGATALAGAQSRKAGLGMIGSVQAQSNKAALGLASQEESARRQNEQSLTRAAQMQASEKEKEFKSSQEKQQLKANMAMQELAKKRSQVSQGLSAIGQGLGTMASTGSYGSGMFNVGKKKKAPESPVALPED